MGRVKLYGSNTFTPNDLPAGVTLERGTISAFYAGCLGGSCCVPPGSGGGYSDVAWRTHTEWSYGGYFCAGFPSDYNRSCDPLTVMQNSNTNDGIDFFTNHSTTKKLVARVGMDLPDAATVNYVRVWMSGTCPTNNNKIGVRPFYWIIGTSGDPASGVPPGGEEVKTWAVDGPNPTYFVLNKGGAGVVQKSTKLLAIPGRTLTGKLLKNTGWGLKIPSRDEPGVNVVNFWINELGVEVGFDIVLYDVTTDSCTPTSTTLTVTGTVNPHGDAGGNYRFQYGTTVGLGSSTPLVPQPSSTTYTATALITGLTVSTTYYYRLVAIDSSGVPHYGTIKNCFTQSGCTTHVSLVGA